MLILLNRLSENFIFSLQKKNYTHNNIGINTYIILLRFTIHKISRILINRRDYTLLLYYYIYFNRQNSINRSFRF